MDNMTKDHKDLVELIDNMMKFLEKIVDMVMKFLEKLGGFGSKTEATATDAATGTDA